MAKKRGEGQCAAWWDYRVPQEVVVRNMEQWVKKDKQGKAQETRPKACISATLCTTISNEDTAIGAKTPRWEAGHRTPVLWSRPSVIWFKQVYSTGSSTCRCMLFLSLTLHCPFCVATHLGGYRLLCVGVQPHLLTAHPILLHLLWFWPMLLVMFYSFQ